MSVCQLSCAPRLCSRTLTRSWAGGHTHLSCSQNNSSAWKSQRLVQTAQRCSPINLCNHIVLVLLESLQGKYFQREKDLVFGEQPFNPHWTICECAQAWGRHTDLFQHRLLQPVPQPHQSDVCTWCAFYCMKGAECIFCSIHSTVN